MERTIIKVNDKELHLVLHKTYFEWFKRYGDCDNFWDILIEDLLDNSIEVNEDIWYWLIDGRCFETDQVVVSEV